MKKSDLLKRFRERTDPALLALGFRWRRMVDSSEGSYVRAWAGGRDTAGFGVASYYPHFSIQSYVTICVDAVAEVILPHAGLVSPRYEPDFFICHASAATFLNGPCGNRHHAWEVTTEEEVDVAADLYVSLMLDQMEPWLRSLRTPAALWAMAPEWQKVCFSPMFGMVEAALAFLCVPFVEAEALLEKHLASAEQLPAQEQRRLQALVTDLQARLAVA